MNKKNSRLLVLNNDFTTKNVTTFKNGLDTASMLVVVLPTDFEEWEEVMIKYKPKNKI